MDLLTPLFSKTSKKGQPRLAIVGGRLEDDNRAVYREMRRLSGGKVLIFPTASSEPMEVGEETRVAFEMHGFTADVAALFPDNATVSAFDPEIVEKVRTVGSVYFTGGDQTNVLNALVQNGKETPVLKAIKALVRRGGMIAGSSAGAAIMSREMILGGTSFEAMAHGVSTDPKTPGIMVGRGLGFFAHGMIDQHFIKRGRLARLVVAMAHAGQHRGFGVDENTALIVEGTTARVVGEYGVFAVDMRKAAVDVEARSFDDIRLSYLDDGDAIDLRSFTARPAESKRRVLRSEIAYRAPARSRRNAFGAYAIYDLVARLVLGDQHSYSTDELVSVDAKSAICARVELSRMRWRSRCLIANPDTGVRVTAVNLAASLRSSKLEPEALAERSIRGARSFGMDLNERSKIVLLGSSPIYYQPAEAREIVGLLTGPVGIFAAASAEARRTAEEHVAFLKRHGVEAIDLGVTFENVDRTAKDEAALNKIAAMKTLFLCGGNQNRLVETLLYRGEESAVLRAIANAFSHGATLVAASGAVSAVSGVMIAGGATREALRFGVASDEGHLGLTLREGVGLFNSGIADQNILTARRLGRLVVACAEANERFGIGVCEESAVVASKSGRELKAYGRYGFVQIESDPVRTAPQDDRFIARGIKLRMFGPGDMLNLNSGYTERGIVQSPAAKLAFERMLQDLMHEGVDFDQAHRDLRHAVRLRIVRESDLTAVLDLECAREEHDD